MQHWHKFFREPPVFVTILFDTTTYEHIGYDRNVDVRVAMTEEGPLSGQARHIQFPEARPANRDGFVVSKKDEKTHRREEIARAKSDSRGHGIISAGELFLFYR